MAFTDNIKEITPAITQLKSNTPVIVIDGKIYVAGIGGNFIPGSAAASQSGTENIAAGYITISDSIITVHNVTDGTTSTTDKLYIADTGVEEPDYAAGGTPQPSPASMAFYKCAAVYSDSTWSGYKAVLNPQGYYQFQSESTEGLVYTKAPAIGSIYPDGAVQKISYLPLASLNSSAGGLVFYAPFTSIEQTAATGQSLTYTSGHTVTATVKDGIRCLKADQYSSGGYAITAMDSTLPSGTNPSSISMWIKINTPWSNAYRDTSIYHGGSTGVKRGFGTGVISSYYNGKFIVYGVHADPIVQLFIAPTEWHNICIVYTANSVSLYIDGFLVSQTTQENSSTAQDIKICEHRFSDIYFTSARIYNRALSDFEIKMLAAQFTPTAN